MTPRKRSGVMIVLLVAGSAMVSLLGTGLVFWLMFVGVDSDYVAMPAMTLEVVDEAGVAVPNARVVIEHRIQPHDLDVDRTERTTSAEGRVVTELVIETEKVAPLCMHGVPGHQHFVCVDHPGAMPVVLQVESTESPIAITIPLRRDPSATHACGEDLERMLLTARTPRADLVETDTVLGASEP